VDYQVRTARITDVDRLVALFAPAVDPSGGPLVALDLLRQLIYLPQASVLVAERRREVIGGAILALRPSVRSGGYIGSIDLLVVDPSGDATSVTNDLLEEILRSARNKGCTVVEAARPDDPGERARWEDRGFSQGGSLMTRSVAARRATARQTRI
jgi:N-acetylglutamate synthase-like GNAT family acetyltransferase